MLVSNISPKLNNSQSKPNFTSFHANPESKIFKPVIDKVVQPSNKIYDKLTDLIAHGIGKVLDNDITCSIIEKSSQCNKLISHLIVLGSTILSGFYIKKTLGNDQLDEHKKKTLAINQAAVWAASTIMAYTLDGAVNKKINAFSDKFKEINIGQENLSKHLDGIKAAKSIIVMGLVYRYIAPVIVTPIANAIGNKLEEKQENKVH